MSRLAALQMAFFASGHDASTWLTGWYPETPAMQVDCVHRAHLARYGGAGTAPVFEIIASLGPRFINAKNGATCALGTAIASAPPRSTMPPTPRFPNSPEPLLARLSNICIPSTIPPPDDDTGVPSGIGRDPSGAVHNAAGEPHFRSLRGLYGPPLARRRRHWSRSMITLFSQLARPTAEEYRRRWSRGYACAE
ncbi:hypothetical protein [Mycobacterium saskatchewanense]|uniref:hypothetical protein n=1 Tax=Mycobacterium saskatchewanense TaxID=220927 RepID=UPI001153F216|nr:hypothetical protein [Mycobacterium saskatchewanense]